MASQCALNPVLLCAGLVIAIIWVSGLGSGLPTISLQWENPETDNSTSAISDAFPAATPYPSTPPKTSPFDEFSAAEPESRLATVSAVPEPQPVSVAEADQSFARVTAVPEPQPASIQIPLLDESASQPLGAPQVRVPRSGTTCDPVCNGTCNEELGRCDLGYQPKCAGGDELCYDILPGKNDYKPFSVPYSTFCFGDCSEHGKCERGFCHCEPGYWGTDCGISRAEDGTLLLHDRAAPIGKEVLRPSVYVYELPPKFTVWPRRVGLTHNRGGLNYAFAERMFRSAHRTLDPAAADLFYAPGMGNHRDVSPIPAYIRKTWPELIGETGDRHIWPSTDQPWGIFMDRRGGYNKGGEYYTFDGKIPENLKDSTFMDLRGSFKLEAPLNHGQDRVSAFRSGKANTARTRVLASNIAACARAFVNDAPDLA
ncbi:hypothetical protein CYMTET_9025 [Cymbomonas tetramitiformis]|uniref:EGF-like domain-containing protein n=1 Tax=Cymbomonas tetramitiformis TaxID=36881 RepID=A0AAE0GRW3_9CHLO|nr:hypothetical protein CYMTET_9025 [Cymbomonas tetramitiformis]